MKSCCAMDAMLDSPLQLSSSESGGLIPTQLTTEAPHANPEMVSRTADPENAAVTLRVAPSVPAVTICSTEEDRPARFLTQTRQYPNRCEYDSDGKPSVATTATRNLPGAVNSKIPAVVMSSTRRPPKIVNVPCGSSFEVDPGANLGFGSYLDYNARPGRSHRYPTSPSSPINIRASASCPAIITPLLRSPLSVSVPSSTLQLERPRMGRSTSAAQQMRVPNPFADGRPHPAPTFVSVPPKAMSRSLPDVYERPLHVAGSGGNTMRSWLEKDQGPSASASLLTSPLSVMTPPHLPQRTVGSQQLTPQHSSPFLVHVPPASHISCGRVAPDWSGSLATVDDSDSENSSISAIAAPPMGDSSMQHCIASALLPPWDPHISSGNACDGGQSPSPALMPRTVAVASSPVPSPDRALAHGCVRSFNPTMEGAVAADQPWPLSWSNEASVSNPLCDIFMPPSHVSAAAHGLRDDLELSCDDDGEDPLGGSSCSGSGGSWRFEQLVSVAPVSSSLQLLLPLHGQRTTEVAPPSDVVVVAEEESAGRARWAEDLLDVIPPHRRRHSKGAGGESSSTGMSSSVVSPLSSEASAYAAPQPTLQQQPWPAGELVPAYTPLSEDCSPCPAMKPLTPRVLPVPATVLSISVIPLHGVARTTTAVDASAAVRRPYRISSPLVNGCVEVPCLPQRSSSAPHMGSSSRAIKESVGLPFVDETPLSLSSLHISHRQRGAFSDPLTEASASPEEEEEARLTITALRKGCSPFDMVRPSLHAHHDSYFLPQWSDDDSEEEEEEKYGPLDACH